jgi:hypothetical protein
MPHFYQVFKWFLRMTPIFATLAGAQEQRDNDYNPHDFETVVLAAINAIGVCYYVRISARVEYLDAVAQYFRFPFKLYVT